MIRGIFRPRKAISRRFSCYDMTMNIAPGAILTATGLVVNVSATVYRFVTDRTSPRCSCPLRTSCAGCFDGVHTGCHHDRDRVAEHLLPRVEKILFTFTFPLFMFTYVPICIASLFARRVGWKPIRHKRAVTIRQIAGAGD